MPNTSTAATRDTTPSHEELTSAHEGGCQAAAALHESLVRYYQTDIVTARRQAIHLGSELERIAAAERDCGRTSGLEQKFTKSYQAMLDQHRLAFLDFEQLSRELEKDLPPEFPFLARLVADIEHHLNAAEHIHQECMAAAA